MKKLFLLVAGLSVFLASCAPSLVAPNEPWGQRYFYPSADLLRYFCMKNHDSIYDSRSLEDIHADDLTLDESSGVTFSAAGKFVQFSCGAMGFMGPTLKRTKTESGDIVSKIVLRNPLVRATVKVVSSSEPSEIAVKIIPLNDALESLGEIQGKFSEREGDKRWFEFKDFSDSDKQKLLAMSSFSIMVKYPDGEKSYTVKPGSMPSDADFGAN